MSYIRVRLSVGGRSRGRGRVRGRGRLEVEVRVMVRVWVGTLKFVQGVRQGQLLVHTEMLPRVSCIDFRKGPVPGPSDEARARETPRTRPAVTAERPYESPRFSAG